MHHKKKSLSKLLANLFLCSCMISSQISPVMTVLADDEVETVLENEPDSAENETTDSDELTFEESESLTEYIDDSDGFLLQDMADFQDEDFAGSSYESAKGRDSGKYDQNADDQEFESAPAIINSDQVDNSTETSDVSVEETGSGKNTVKELDIHPDVYHQNLHQPDFIPGGSADGSESLNPDQNKTNEDNRTDSESVLDQEASKVLKTTRIVISQNQKNENAGEDEHKSKNENKNENTNENESTHTVYKTVNKNDKENRFFNLYAIWRKDGEVFKFEKLTSSNQSLYFSSPDNAESETDQPLPFPVVINEKNGWTVTIDGLVFEILSDLENGKTDQVYEIAYYPVECLEDGSDRLQELKESDLKIQDDQIFVSGEHQDIEIDSWNLEFNAEKSPDTLNEKDPAVQKGPEGETERAEKEEKGEKEEKASNAKEDEDLDLLNDEKSYTADKTDKENAADPENTADKKGQEAKDTENTADINNKEESAEKEAENKEDPKDKENLKNQEDQKEQKSGTLNFFRNFANKSKANDVYLDKF